VALESVRIPFVQRARFEARGVARDVFLVDLGLEGVFVETREALEPGDAVEIRFRLPGNAIPVEGRGRVAWVHPGGAEGERPTGVGVQFVALGPAERARLREYLEGYCRRQGRARRFARPWPQPAGAEGGGA
jgi:uncharacterized protein (TIGR02266 family)